jgi:hypothetical protein
MASSLIQKISGAVDFFQSIPRKKKSKFDSIQPPTAQALGGSGFSCGSSPARHDRLPFGALPLAVLQG